MRDPTYTYCREVLAPSTVDCAVGLSMTRAGASNLALARGNVLELYEVRLAMAAEAGDDGSAAGDEYLYKSLGNEDFDLPVYQDDSRRRGGGGSGSGGSASKQPQLRLAHRWQLHGHIKAMQAVGGGGAQRADRLLLSFAEAKMSLVAFDAGSQALVTESIHYYEHEGLARKSFNDHETCALRADPDGRCVAMRIYDDQLAVLPLATAGDGGAAAAQSFVVDLRQAGVNVRNVRDFAFLNGYLEPTLAVLHEQRPTWPGMVAVARDTSSVTVLSLDMTRRGVSVLNAAGRLPSDAARLVVVAEPIGGVLVVGAGAISHVISGTLSCISVLNRVAARGIGAAQRDAVDRTNEALGLVLDAGRAAFAAVGANTLAMWSQHGFVYALRLEGDGRLVRRIAVRQVRGCDPLKTVPPPVASTWDDIAVPPSCVAALRLADDDAAADARLLFVGGAAGRSLLLGVDGGGEAAAEPGDWAARLRFAVHDEILGTGPVVGMDVGARGDGLELVTCGGNEWRGCLRVQQRHVQPQVVASFDLPGAPARGVWTVRCLAEYNIGGVMQAAEAAGLGAAADTFVVVSRAGGTTVLTGGDELAELGASGFYTAGPTVAVGAARGSTRVVQVHASGLRVVDAHARETQAVVFTAAADAVAAEVADAHVLVRMADGAFAMYAADADSGELREMAVPDAMRGATAASLFEDAQHVLATNREYVERNRDALRERAAAASAAGAGAAGGDGALDSVLDSVYGDASLAEAAPAAAAKRKAARRTAGGRSKQRRRHAEGAVSDDDFDALYDEIADEAADDSDASDASMASDAQVPKPASGGQAVRGESPVYALAALAGGDLAVFRLPSFERVWTTPRFDDLGDVLAAGRPGAGGGAAGGRIDEFRLVQLGGDDIATAHLLAITSAGEVAVYRAFDHCARDYVARRMAAPAAAALADDGELALRFARMRHDVLAYEPDYERHARRVQARLTRAFDAWRARDQEREAERELEGEAARERARATQQREEAVVDWGESDDDGGPDEPEAAPAPAPAAAPAADADDIYADHDAAPAAAAPEPAAVPVADDGPAATPDDPDEVADDLDEADDHPPGSRFTVLDNLGGYAAVLVAGPQPLVVLVGSKRYARVHPLRLTTRLPAWARTLPEALLARGRPIVAAARFHSRACEHGLVALTQAGTLVVAALAASSRVARGGVEYDAPWPARTLPVGTQHPGIAALGGVAFHRPSGSWVAAAASADRFYIREPNRDIAARQAREDAGPPGSAAAAAASDLHLVHMHERRAVHTTSVPPLQPRAHLDLLSPVTWETVDSHAFAPGEHVAALRVLALESTQSASGRRAVVCVGTAFVLGEDVATRGAVYVFDVVDIVPLPGRPQTNRRLKLLCREEVGGAVTALAELRGNLAMTVGSKVFVRSLQRAEQLVSVAFLDCQSCVRALAGLNAFLLVADLARGLWLAAFQEEGPTRVEVLGREPANSLALAHADFLALGRRMLLLAADALGALHMFAYAPYDAHSAAGQRLLRRGEFNLHSPVAALVRLVAAAAGAAAEPQQVCLAATAAGAVHAVAMVPEKSFKRLRRVAARVAHAAPPLAGLNPRGFRAVPPHRRQYAPPRPTTVLDGDLLAPLYAHAPLSRQHDAAQRDGTSADRVLRDIVAIERAFDFF
ncbi:mRNA cleavage and polyadenylation factor subunit [Coemansia interrupta]|uniref:mRNA cleavage and polyadenylation factor subunit n=1 Tax=Coemansia interrupta TaxID=1126814 RepID=A0A9W8LLM7_9FUNG|nr:mRNA cleavage and polyadenylation factor subunit [Coemansia interrupta]